MRGIWAACLLILVAVLALELFKVRLQRKTIEIMRKEREQQLQALLRVQRGVVGRLDVTSDTGVRRTLIVLSREDLKGLALGVELAELAPLDLAIGDIVDAQRRKS